MKDLWDGIYKSFKAVYPNLSKRAIGYRPYSFSRIVVWFEDGAKMLYNGTLQKGYWLTD